MGVIRFELRAEIKDRSGRSPIRLVYSIQSKRKYFPTGIKLYQWQWDQKQQQAIFWRAKKDIKAAHPDTEVKELLTQKEVDDINKDIAALRAKVIKIEKKFEALEQPYNAAMVLSELAEKKKKQTLSERTSKELFAFMDHYLNTTIRKPGSLSVYRALKAHLQAYQEHTGRAVTFDALDYNFFESFKYFLVDVRGLSNTTVAKQLSTVKTFIGYAKRHKIPVGDEHKNYKIDRDELEVIALTAVEFERLFYMDLSHDLRLAKVRDAFCFSCATGLRYSDLKQLNSTHIKRDEIQLTSQKTEQILRIPLNPYSKAILDRYKDCPTPIPVISNAKMNQRLNGKDVYDEKGKLVKHYPGLCELAGISDPVEIVRYRGTKREAKIYPKYELITCHVGRKTFCTLSLEKGMTAEEVMAISGHKSYKSFSRYIKVTEDRKKQSMAKAWGEIKDNKLKAV
jgi:integrase/uncharacterized protein YeaC (DUF1315 family)